MKIRILVYGICIFFIIIIQSTILDVVQIYGVKPNLMLVFIVSVALINGSVQGAAVGFILGLMQDIISGKIIGFYCLLGLYLGLIIGSVNKRLYRENLLIIIFFTFISTVVYEELVYILNTFLSGNLNFTVSFANIIFPEAIYNMFVSIFIYMFVVKVNQKIEVAGNDSGSY
ncbi:MAG: rod shape-determining protein MreD [Clostridia bacterium]|jgi:rod shape-determining protein MreD